MVIEVDIMSVHGTIDISTQVMIRELPMKKDR